MCWKRHRDADDIRRQCYSSLAFIAYYGTEEAHRIEEYGLPLTAQSDARRTEAEADRETTSPIFSEGIEGVTGCTEGGSAHSHHHMQRFAANWVQSPSLG